MAPRSGRLLDVRTAVLGAANGIGEAVARTCVRHDARVYATDSADTDIEARFNGVNKVTAAAHGAGEDAHADAVDAAAEALGGLDAVVYAADLQPRTPVTDAAAKDQVLKPRLAGIERVFARAAPLLERSPGGRFVVIGLLRSAFSRDAQILCDSAEQQLAELVRRFAASAGQAGTTVNYVQPGAVMTPESRRVFVGDKKLRDYCIQHSAARRLGEPLDVARAVLFLVSDDAAFVSGAGISVDGGRARER